MSHPNQLVLVAKRSLLENSGKISAVKLKHPRSGKLVTFLWNQKTSELLEIQRVTDNHRSWFLGNKIKSDGALHLCTPIDPLFILVPALECNTRFTTLEVLLSDCEGAAHVFAHESDVSKRIQCICDFKVVGAHTVYRYNSTLALKWLETRVNKVQESILRAHDPSMAEQIRLALSYTPLESSEHTADAIVPEFAKDSAQAKLMSNAEVDPKDALQFAYHLVCDYLPPHLASSLGEHLGISTVTNPSDSDDLPNQENVEPMLEAKSGHNGVTSNSKPTEDYSNALKPAASEKFSGPMVKKAKVIKGMQSITNFFVKHA
ncbi:unnamed protein product [Calicophoron daubneyi]|uniref:Ribonuclease H2 subunit B n=1 Tax=Calicophoron daubneyi TaxID=300641 RepID=A0AAV2T2I4_CALDB